MHPSVPITLADRFVTTLEALYAAAAGDEDAVPYPDD
jgi:hypothetical protein